MRLAVASIALAVFLGASVADARDHRAPRTTLRVAGQVQKGLQYHADGWSKPTEDGRFCDVSFAHGLPEFSKPLHHAPGQEIVVRLHKKTMPLEVEVQRWPRVNGDGHAAGTATPLPWLLRPHMTGTSIGAWEVVVLPPIVNGHLYLGVGAYWADEDGCSPQPDLGSQYAAWTFHLMSH